MTQLSEIIKLYSVEILPRKRPNTRAVQQNQLKFWEEHLGDRDANLLTAVDIIKTRSLIQCSDATKNQYMAVISHVFSIAVKEFGLMKENPILKISKLKNPRGRVRFLSEEEKKELLIACEESSNPYLYTVVFLALSTGARKMEIMNLKWKDVDLDKRLFYLRETKNGKTRTLPLVSKAHDLLLENFKTSTTELLFPSARYNDRPILLRLPFLKALKKAKIENFRFHDLRHTCASYLAMFGVPLNVIAEILGHTGLAMVMRYAHLSTEHLSEVLNNMADKILIQ